MSAPEDNCLRFEVLNWARGVGISTQFHRKWPEEKVLFGFSSSSARDPSWFISFMGSADSLLYLRCLWPRKQLTPSESISSLKDAEVTGQQGKSLTPYVWVTTQMPAKAETLSPFTGILSFSGITDHSSKLKRGQLTAVVGLSGVVEMGFKFKDHILPFVQLPAETEFWLCSSDSTL